MKLCFKKNENKKATIEIKAFLNATDVSKPSEDHVKRFWGRFKRQRLYRSLKSMKNDKSADNDGFTKDF